MRRCAVLIFRIALGPMALGSMLLGALPGCAGGGSGANAPFDLVEVSVQDGGVWQINRPIRLTFGGDVDFASVSLNTIHVARDGGAPATGEFSLEGSRTVVFQPTCPALDDYSDAGLAPGGVLYRLDVPGGTAGGPAVRSTDGAALSHSHSVRFLTPDSTDPGVLFLDPRPGPPAPVIRSAPGVVDASYLEIGEDAGNRVYFEPRAVADADLGADVPAGFAAGLNLYSDLSTHVALVIALDQPVNPSSANVSVDTVRLEYLDAAGAWRRLAHTVQLVANCSGSGARLRLTPTGILPQNHLVRAVLTQDFEDLVGQGNLVLLAVGTFLVATATDPGGSAPGDGGDEVLEEFSAGGDAPGSREDNRSPLLDPRATWGPGGMLRAGFAFDGTGGPGGDFDWQIGSDPPAPPQTIVLDTTFAVITNAQQTAQAIVIGGRVDVRNLTIKANGTLIVQGPHPCRILVAGSARIDGTILVKGNSNLGVVTLGTANIPEPGAPGQAGGGRGGTGSYLTTQSTPAGQGGYGAFDTENGGGGGGESGFNPDVEPEGHRRAGGGGGGTFGRDLLRPSGIVPGYTNPNSCPDQSLIGLDAEPGFRGAPTAGGAFHPGQPPLGGPPGPRPFFDGDPANDFWGTMLTQAGVVVTGELPGPWAGAGGGAGGDSITAATFPPPFFDPNSDEKGSGGGGGGGSITILALGDIALGPAGRIDASGGVGGGGEDQFPVRRIAGGSGGGSGGHVVLQTASRIDLSQCTSSTIPPGGLYALGGQGGEGADARGGARGGTPTTLDLDALPPNSYPSASAPCRVANGQAGYTFSNTVGDGDPANVVICCGGDGGPGIVQLHAPTLADILPPAAVGESIFTVCKPPPIGSAPVSGVPALSRINTPSQWDQLLPIFGRRSQAISKWIPLGAASVSSDLTASAPDPVQFSFSGTDASGVILTTGSGPAAKVAELPPILSGVLAGSPTPPYVAADLRTVVFDPTSPPIGDDIYLRNTALLKRFVLRLTHGVATDFEVASASYDAATHALRLTVDASGMPLAGFLPGDAVEVRPRFFRVITNGVPNSLPDSSQIVVEFQTTTENLQGDPDTGTASAWVQDITLLDPNTGANPDYRFLRFRISFDISANGAPLTFDTPIPSLDFFRVPFRF